jgi:hypothetical protein
MGGDRTPAAPFVR